MSQWHLNPIGGTPLVVLVALAVLALAMVVGLALDRTTPRRRMILLGMRVAIFLLILLAMLRPTRVFTEMKKQSATLVLLIDRSKSMLVADGLNGSRWYTVQTAIRQALPALQELDEDLEIKVYGFDRDLTAMDFTDGRLDVEQKPTGSQSAIGAALEDVLRREAGKRLAGVILLSDGAQQAYAPRDIPPEAPARRLANLGYPLYTLVVGQARSASQSRDIALKDLQVSPNVFVKNELPVEGTASFFGLNNQSLRAELLFETQPGKMEVVNSSTVRPTRDGQQLPVDMKLIPEAPGERKLTLRLPAQPEELVTTNNELSTFVTVLKGGLKVLYVDSSVAPESTFLRRSLNASPDIKVDYHWFSVRDRASWPRDLGQAFQPGQYDVYILGDVDSSAFRKQDLESLRTAVQRGAGLIMLGGFQSFWGGGYQSTALADVLPVEPDNLERGARQRLDQPPRKDLHLEGPLKMLPSRRASLTSMMTLAAGEENRAAWDKLPPLTGANRFSSIKPTAQVLAEAASGEPLLVAVEPGAGRALAFGGDSTWQWWMQGHEAVHKRFWRQVVLWLARKDDAGENSVWVRLDQRRFTPGRRVDFTAGAQTAQGDVIEDAQYTAEVTLPDGSKRPVRMSRQGAEVSGLFLDNQQPGDYSIAVTVTKDDAVVGTATARFLVFEQDLELENAAARPTLLAHLSQITASAGGEALAAEQLPDLLEKLKQQPPDLEVETQVVQTPWDSPGYFLLLVGLLSGEWYLRKRWGLV